MGQRDISEQLGSIRPKFKTTSLKVCIVTVGTARNPSNPLGLIMNKPAYNPIFSPTASWKELHTRTGRAIPYDAVPDGSIGIRDRIFYASHPGSIRDQSNQRPVISPTPRASIP